MQSLFKTSIKDLIDRNKFFQCFICYEQFNEQQRFPMQVCKRQHFMCKQCVDNKAFKVIRPNKFACGLCLTIINQKDIKKSPFLLSIKDFINNLISRQQTRKLNYKQCIEKQNLLITKLMKQNQLKDEKISQLNKKVQNLQKEILQNLKQIQSQQIEIIPQPKKQSIFKSCLFKNSIFRQNNIQQPIGQYVFESKKQEKKEQKIQIQPIIRKNQLKSQKKQYPSQLMQLFNQVWAMKQQLQKDQQISKKQLKKRLAQLQKHQKYLEKIALQLNQNEQQKEEEQQKNIQSQPRKMNKLIQKEQNSHNKKSKRKPIQQIYPQISQNSHQNLYSDI